jgi:hypothetical protein
MNDDELRRRIAAGDPMLDGVPIDPVTSAEARHLLEAIVNTDLDTPTAPTDRSSDGSTTDRAAVGGTVERADRSTPVRNEPRRRRWTFAALGAAAAGVLAVAGAAVGGVFDGGEPNLASEPTVLELSGGETDPSMMSCIQIDPSIIAQSPVAFRGFVDSVEGETVTLTVDRWYAGGDADVVTITAPLGMEALIGSIDFVVGEPYLISAYEGVVSYCEMSGPATPERQQMYDEAFPG